jgi:hypothetical protein
MLNVVELVKVAGALTPLTVAVAPFTKLVPVTVTVSPGLADMGLRAVTVGTRGVTVRFCPLEVWPATVTVTDGMPALTFGTVKVRVVELVTTTFEAAVPPTLTVAPEAKLVPDAVTVAPGVAEVGASIDKVGGLLDDPPQPEVLIAIPDTPVEPP